VAVVVVGRSSSFSPARHARMHLDAMRPSLESGRFLGSGESDEEKRRAGRAVVETRCSVETAGLGFRKMEVFRGGFKEWTLLGAGLGRFRFVGGGKWKLPLLW
jgi:hypothetical protein